ncbi:TPA: hypothetical protein QCI29_004448 [Enterobacter mori]|nr:hypothetical protein [Enterobacter mori]
MRKVTFVFMYEDGKEPPVNSGMEFMGAKIVAVSFSDALEYLEEDFHECSRGNLKVEQIISDLNESGPISRTLTGNMNIKTIG